MTMFAERGGVSSRDIIRISMGANTNTRVIAVKTGAAQATTVDPGGLVFAQKRARLPGFSRGSLSHALSGLRHHERKIRENPAQIKRWLKAAIRGLMFVRKDRRKQWISESKNFSSAPPPKPCSSKRRKIICGLCLREYRACPLRRASKISWSTTSRSHLQIKEEIPAGALAQLAACRRSKERA